MEVRALTIDRAVTMSVSTRHTVTASADAAKLLERLGLAILMIGLPCAGIVSSGAIYVLMPVGAIVILIGQTLDRPLRGLRNLSAGLRSPLGGLVLFLLFWMALSLIWTPFPAPAIERFSNIVFLVLLAAAAAGFLPQRVQSFELFVLPWGVAAASALTLAAAYAGAPSFWNGSAFDETLFERSTITLIVLVWPAVGVLSLREHWLASAILAVLVSAVALSGYTRIALAAMGAGAFTFAVAMSAPDRVARFLAFAFSASILLAPLIPFVYGFLPNPGDEAGQGVSAEMRVWAGTVSGQWPRLVTGHGFDAAGQGTIVGFLPADTPRSLLFLVWYDLGVIGAVTVGALMAGVPLIAARGPASAVPALLAGLVVVSTLAVTGVATRQIWWVTLLGCAAIATTLLVNGARRHQRPAVEAIGEPGVSDIPSSGSSVRADK